MNYQRKLSYLTMKQCNSSDYLHLRTYSFHSCVVVDSTFLKSNRIRWHIFSALFTLGRSRQKRHNAHTYTHSRTDSNKIGFSEHTIRRDFCKLDGRYSKGGVKETKHEWKTRIDEQIVNNWITAEQPYTYSNCYIPLRMRCGRRKERVVAERGDGRKEGRGGQKNHRTANFHLPFRSICFSVYFSCANSCLGPVRYSFKCRWLIGIVIRPTHISHTLTSQANMQTQ